MRMQRSISGVILKKIATVVPHQQQNAKRCQMVWQLAVGTGIHIVDGGRVSEIPSVEIIEGPLLASRHIWRAGHRQ
jgi:hypothetical protein